jgi:plastocyanin
VSKYRATRTVVTLALALAWAGVNAAQVQTHVVTIEGMHFSPAQMKLKRGDKVVWQNKDLVPHTATASRRFDSGSIAPGTSWSRTFAAPGRYDYVCTFHPGMKGVLVVSMR